jgi:DNA-binding Xre family transcriptional regulator
MVGTRLKDLRSVVQLPRRLSCKELDRLASLTPGHVWTIEHKANGGVETETVRRLCEVLGCTVGWLANGEGKRPSDAAVRKAVEAARQKHACTYAQS